MNTANELLDLNKTLQIARHTAELLNIEYSMDLNIRRNDDLSELVEVIDRINTLLDHTWEEIDAVFRKS